MELAISLNNQQFELAGPFTFYGDSIFESMVPLSGPDLGGTRVVIRGPNLAPGLAPELLTLSLTLTLTLNLTLTLTLTLALTLALALALTLTLGAQRCRARTAKRESTPLAGKELV